VSHPPSSRHVVTGSLEHVIAQRRCILTVHAHPDDEASKGAPTLAMYHDQGAYTVLVCATGGEEGDLQNPGLREEGQPFHGLTPEEEKGKLAELRPAELAESARIIGFDEVVMLGYRDSGMLDTPPNQHPDSFNMAPLDEATGRLVAIIRRTKPQVIITYSDDQSGYPHPDHVKVHDISVLAFERAGDPAWYPEAGEPFQPSKMYYTMWSKARLLAVHEALIERRGESPYDEKWLSRPGQDERITTKLDVGQFLWARSGALRAHATQVDPKESWWFGLADDELAEVYPYEDWVLAHSHVGDVEPGTIETDLFAGVDLSAEHGAPGRDAEDHVA
jgi:mycothiol S-conjugate amidase